MARARTIGLITALWLGGASAAVAEPLPAIVLHLDDRANVPPGELAAAKAEVERTFRAAGIEIGWAEGRFPVSIRKANAEFPESRHVPVMLVNHVAKTSLGATGCALGLASPPLAFVFYNRIVETSLARPVDVPVVLGRVITHEVGHLLLPRNSHSRYGIMRANLDVEFANPHRFTEDQAQRMRAVLASHPAELAVAR